MEQLHHEWTFSAHLNQRVVASGVWEYLVDLTTLSQTNIKHPANKQRHIRRWTSALGDDQTPPGQLQPVKEEEEDNSTGTPQAAALSGVLHCSACVALLQGIDLEYRVLLRCEVGGSAACDATLHIFLALVPYQPTPASKWLAYLILTECSIVQLSHLVLPKERHRPRESEQELQ